MSASSLVFVDSEASLRQILRTLRSTLHACAERSGTELLTAQIVANFLAAYAPDELVCGLGGQGVAALFAGALPGPTVLVRAELDALPVEESDAWPDLLTRDTSHRCGHDGHMSIVAGLAPTLATHRPARGNVVLLFQPAEETGEGALAVLDDPRFEPLKPDFALGFHNVPGRPMHSIVCRSGTFASASVGMRVELEGSPSHAAEPEKARTPVRALQSLLGTLPALADLDADPYRLLTVTHMQMGRESFGTTPGHATVCATLRSGSGAGLAHLCLDAEQLVREAARQSGLDLHIEWVERFPETHNDQALVGRLEEVCRVEGLSYQTIVNPFRWSDDFGHIASTCPSVYFGLGAGEDAAGLHQPDFHFADELLLSGLTVLRALVRNLTESPAMVGHPAPV